MTPKSYSATPRAGVANSVSATDALPGNVANTAYFNAPQLNSFGLGGVRIASADSINVNAP